MDWLPRIWRSINSLLCLQRERMSSSHYPVRMPSLRPVLGEPARTPGQHDHSWHRSLCGQQGSWLPHLCVPGVLRGYVPYFCRSLAVCLNTGTCLYCVSAAAVLNSQAMENCCQPSLFFATDGPVFPARWLRRGRGGTCCQTPTSRSPGVGACWSQLPAIVNNMQHSRVQLFLAAAACNRMGGRTWGCRSICISSAAVRLLPPTLKLTIPIYTCWPDLHVCILPWMYCRLAEAWWTYGWRLTSVLSCKSWLHAKVAPLKITWCW